MNSKTTTEKQSAFFAAVVATGGNVTRACKAVELDRSTPYRWAEEDPEFAEMFARAKQLGAEVLEDAVRGRAFDGVTEPIYYLGSKVGTIQKYSDTLAIFLLKGAMPEKYRERADVSMKGEVNLIEAIRAGRARAGL